MNMRISRAIGVIALLLTVVGIVGLLSILRPEIDQDGDGFSQRAFLSPLPTSVSISILPTPSDTTAVQAALTYQEQFLPNRSENSQVMFTRLIRFKDFSDLGLGAFVPSAGSDPQLQVVLLKGNFDTSNYGITQKVPFTQAAYLVVVYDLDQKAIANVTLSVNGDEIRPLLEMAGEKPLTPAPTPQK